MTKEFEIVQKIVLEAEQRKITEQKALTDKKSQEQKKLKQVLEKEKRTNNNGQILKNSGVVKLFQEIIDSGLVKMKNEPCYENRPILRDTIFGKRYFTGKKRVKISDYEPAIIKWGEECQSVSLVFNRRVERCYIGSCYDEWHTEVSYDSCTFVVLPSGGIGLDKGKNNIDSKSEYVEIKIEEIPQIVSEALVQRIK